MHFWPQFGDSSLNGWQVIVQTSSKWGKIRLSSWIWPWRSRSITPQSYWLLNQCLLHMYSKFGDASLNEWWVIAQTSPWLIHTHTDTQTQATTIPKGQNWPRVKTVNSPLTTQHQIKYKHFYNSIKIYQRLISTGNNDFKLNFTTKQDKNKTP